MVQNYIVLSQKKKIKILWSFTEVEVLQTKDHNEIIIISRNELSMAIIMIFLERVKER